jgi:hypothetical protein
MSDERESNEDDDRGHPSKPEEAPVEAPEADPRTKGAPDPEERSVGPDDYERTQDQIQEAFE